jgi:hypothetical protein
MKPNEKIRISAYQKGNIQEEATDQRPNGRSIKDIPLKLGLYISADRIDPSWRHTTRLC